MRRVHILRSTDWARHAGRHSLISLIMARHGSRTRPDMT